MARLSLLRTGMIILSGFTVFAIISSKDHDRFTIIYIVILKHIQCKYVLCNVLECYTVGK